MEYKFEEIEKKWQEYWQKNEVYKVGVNPEKPKYYVLDMFPYPSGAGLHVGHPLGYIASDIYSRFKRLQGFNVLHPMGYDAFGLPAEQYAIQTGQHPDITTKKNVKRYREQLDKIGFSYDWSREVKTCDPEYYKWTQWAFIQMFKHWFNNDAQKAEPIETLVAEFEKNGNEDINAATSQEIIFTAAEWIAKPENEQQEILLNYRLAYLADTMVNWCPALGTVLANDEVVNGVSVRGGHEVEQKEMKQWSLRISAYAQRLLDDLEKIDWTESLKEIQRNWIGRSEGASVIFGVKGHENMIEVFTTRPDTLYGATFMVLAPEHELVEKITTADHKENVNEYVKWAKNRSERDRISNVNKISGQFTGAYGINPTNGAEVPIWIADYVLMGYGTGAIMAVPGHDSRDFKFANHFDLPVIQVVLKEGDEPTDPKTWEDSYDSKEGKMINSEVLNGMDVQVAIQTAIGMVEGMQIGKGQTNYRLRDAIFSRQRYWGEPFPVYFKDGLPCVLDESDLPLELPEVDKFLPTEAGDPPLGRAENWKTKDGHPLELSTMPGFAGSSAYYYRYMDPKNNKDLVSKEAVEYWQDVDLYIGGTEHATGHLVYARFWNKFLFDLGLVVKEEPFKKLINQGMIQGRSNFVYRIKGTQTFVSADVLNEYFKIEFDFDKETFNVPVLDGLYGKYGKKILVDKLDTKRDKVISVLNYDAVHADVNIVSNDILDIEQFKAFSPDNKDAEFVLNENRQYKCGWEIEKMSKSKYNVVNPDDIIEKYGADTLRMYEMFLGPLEQSKPWDTNGIDGVFKFFRKLWRLFYDDKGNKLIVDDEPTKEELKTLHKTIKKIKWDIENFSFNTSISAFMICVNELSDLKCHKNAILEPLAIILSPYAPHAAEELWETLGNAPSIVDAKFPEFNESYLIENTIKYPVSFNGKMRFTIELPADISREDAEKTVMEHESAQKWLEDKTPKKIIFVPKKIINIVV